MPSVTLPFLLLLIAFGMKLRNLKELPRVVVESQDVVDSEEQIENVSIGKIEDDLIEIDVSGEKFQQSVRWKKLMFGVAPYQGQKRCSDDVNVVLNRYRERLKKNLNNLQLQYKQYDVMSGWPVKDVQKGQNVFNNKHIFLEIAKFLSLKEFFKLSSCNSRLRNTRNIHLKFNVLYNFPSPREYVEFVRRTQKYWKTLAKSVYACIDFPSFTKLSSLELKSNLKLTNYFDTSSELLNLILKNCTASPNSNTYTQTKFQAIIAFTLDRNFYRFHSIGFTEDGFACTYETQAELRFQMWKSRSSINSRVYLQYPARKLLGRGTRLTNQYDNLNINDLYDYTSAVRSTETVWHLLAAISCNTDGTNAKFHTPNFVSTHANLDVIPRISKVTKWPVCIDFKY